MNIDTEDHPDWFKHIEPILVTNSKQKSHSGVFDWPGSAAPFKLNDEESLAYRHPLNSLFNITTFNTTVDHFVDILLTERTNLALLYFGEPGKFEFV